MSSTLSPKQIASFQKRVWDFYKKNKRGLPWRNTKDPYKILVSEVMLQQTQVSRVIQKYNEFIKKFPDFSTLAKGSVRSVLKTWSGLGYNRRALYLKKTANIIVQDYKNKLPQTVEELVKLPGIGKNTAGAVLTFSFNLPFLFIETNIRRVLIYFFYKDQDQVHDRELLRLTKQTLDRKNPRDWYFALMDYGSMLGSTIKNPNRRSKHYVKQSKFEGSLRQVRGEILRLLLKRDSMQKKELMHYFRTKKDYFDLAIQQLFNENFLKEESDIISIKN